MSAQTQWISDVSCMKLQNLFILTQHSPQWFFILSQTLFKSSITLLHHKQQTQNSADEALWEWCAINVESIVKNWFTIEVVNDTEASLCEENVCWVTTEWMCFDEKAEFVSVTH